MTTGAILISAIGLTIIVFFIVALLLKRKSLRGNAVEHINQQIYVGNLPYRVTEADLCDYFSRFGAPQSVRVIRNFKTGDSKGYAFITYQRTEEANAALVAHGTEMHGRSMVVRIAKPRQEQPE